MTVWDQDVFKPSWYTLESLESQLGVSDFGVFLFTPDDSAKIRGEDHRITRDNVLIELGMFVGALGRKRALIVKPRGAADLHLPTDVAGLTLIEYDASRRDDNWVAAVSTACSKIAEAIDEVGPLPRQEKQAAGAVPPQYPEVQVAEANLKGDGLVMQHIRAVFATENSKFALRVQDYGNSFIRDILGDLVSYNETAIGADYEFLDPALEALRVTMRQKLRTFVAFVVQHTFALGGAGSLGVPPEWSETNPARFEKAQRELNESATAVADAYDNLVRATRRLGIA